MRMAVKKSKKLLNFTLDDGTGTDRTILSGIHAYYEPEDLVGKTLLAITNLPPRKMMGIPSCGMLISAIHEEDGEERLNLIQLDASIPAGAKMCTNWYAQERHVAVLRTARAAAPVKMANRERAVQQRVRGDAGPFPQAHRSRSGNAVDFKRPGMTRSCRRAR